MPDAAKNFAKGTVSQGYDDIATSIVLVTGDGTRFPSVPFNATWWNSTDFPDPSDDPFVEVVRVTAKSTDTLTITRAHENTAALEHQIEGKVYKLVAGLTAKVINDEMLPVSRVADEYAVDLPASLNVEAADSVNLNGVSGGVRAQSQAGGVVMEVAANGTAGLGDVDGNNSGAAFLVDDSTGRVSLRGQPILLSIPSSDPAIAGALYYDAGTGQVKRSPG
jgi:hypothetical protein